MIDPILPIKLFRPTARPNAIRRPRLVERLNAEQRLTLISAPAGYGKTALLAEWAAQAKLPIAWLALEADDNVPTRFFSYLIAALNQVAPELGVESLAQLQAPQPPAVQAVLTPLLVELETRSEPLALVLDDYHLISERTIHDGMIFLIEHMPRQLHLIIATRADPPLPLARLRARGQLGELRAADLRFTVEETAAFLNQVMALDLTAEDVQSLEARTEGWIAGLQLAALSLQGRSDRSALIRAFSGSHRHILDYLGEEVLARQSESIQQFLLKTCILERLNSSLCDAVLNASSSQSMLENLEQANLFLVPLDEERNWYRYHHLFADLLRARLRRTVSDAEIAHLHGNAAQWCEANGFPIQAVNHALAANDLERAACIVEQNTIALMTRGELATLLGWIKLLPEAVVRERPWLCVEQGWALVYGGDLERAEALLRQAEQYATSQVDDDRLQGYIAAQRAYIAVTSGQFPRALELATQADQILPQDEYWVRTVIEWARGFALRLQGNLDGAAHAFAEQIRLARACDNIWAYMMGIHDLGVVCRTQGQLRHAAVLVQDGFDLVRARGLANLNYLGRVEVGFAQILYEQNKLQDARKFLLSAIEKNPLWQNPSYIISSQVHLARVLLAQGDLPNAQAALDQCQELLHTAIILPSLTMLAEITQVRLWMAQENWQSVERWVQLHDANPNPFPENREQELLTRVRWLLSQSKANDKLAILIELAESTERSGRISLLIEVKALEALAYFLRGDRNQAFDALEQALTRAEPEGFVRVFLDEGEPMRRLLLEWMNASREGGRMTEYVRELLAAFGSVKEIHPSSFVPHPLVEPLSEREMEVLRGLAHGLSYRDIAEQLVVAQGTVKVHVHNIYSKLGVANRTQAIVRARELALL